MRVQCPDNKVQGIRVNSNGVTIHVYPGKPRRVAPHLVTAAGAAGCYVLPDEDEPNADTPVAPPGETESPNSGDYPDDANEIELPLGGEHEETARHDAVVTAIDTLMGAGDESAFTKSKRPRKSSVVALTGFDVTPEDINQAMDEISNR